MGPVLAKRKFACHDPRMFRKTLLLWLALFLVCPAFSQTETDGETDGGKKTEEPKTADSPLQTRFWQASLSGGQFMVALDRIASVSRHKYLLDGAFVVDEVTVDTVGQALARFYFIRPVSDELSRNPVKNLSDLAEKVVGDVADKAGVDVHNMVIKTYPGTTHAKTIEYRLLTEQDLTSLYTSVSTAWESGRGRKFTAK